MVKVAHGKAFDAEATRAMNERLAREWPALRSELQAIMLPLEKLLAAYAASGTPSTASGLGIEPCFYRQAVLNARDVRDRRSILDLAGDLGLLEEFAEHEE